jgi:hypothetical protein
LAQQLLKAEEEQTKAKQARSTSPASEGERRKARIARAVRRNELADERARLQREEAARQLATLTKGKQQRKDAQIDRTIYGEEGPTLLNWMAAGHSGTHARHQPAASRHSTAGGTPPRHRSRHGGATGGHPDHGGGGPSSDASSSGRGSSSGGHPSRGGGGPGNGNGGGRCDKSNQGAGTPRHSNSGRQGNDRRSNH